MDYSYTISLLTLCHMAGYFISWVVAFAFAFSPSWPTGWGWVGYIALAVFSGVLIGL